MTPYISTHATDSSPGIEVVHLEVFLQRVVIGFRQASTQIYLTDPPRRAPDRVWKEVYEIRPRGEPGEVALVLIKTVEGSHRPAHEVPEQIVWSDEEGKA